MDLDASSPSGLEEHRDGNIHILSTEELA